MSEEQKVVRLKQLLTSWNCKTLFDIFKDEEIFVDELQMMKPHHVNELLRNHKMGLRIRFEYHMEKWRKSINKPLETSVIMQQSKAYTVDSRTTTATPTTLTTATSATPKPQPQNAAKNVQDNVTNSLPAISVAASISTNTIQQFLEPLKRPSTIPKIALATTKEAFYDSGVTVLNILKESGVKGRALLEHYEKHQYISHKQRQLLVRLICSYFDNRDLHMSLKTSHILEQQIVELFPTEKLEYYITENAHTGKIYNALKNMKRRTNHYFPEEEDVQQKKRVKTTDNEILKNLLTEQQDDTENWETVAEQESNYEFFTIEGSNDSLIKIEDTSE